MTAVWYFFGTPALFGCLQFFLTRSRMRRRAKWAPAVVVILVMLACFLGMIDWLPLPETYCMDKSSFLAFPDYIYVGMFCIPALAGLGMGALTAVGVSTDRDKKS